MAERIQDRLGFILTYDVEGDADIAKTREELIRLNKAGLNVNEQAVASHKILAERAEMAQRDAEATGKLAQKQMDLATATTLSNQVVRDVTLSAELLRGEYEQGNITAQEYQQGLEKLRGRLEALQVITLSSARSMRSLSSTEQQLARRTEGVTGSVRTNMLAMNSFSRILAALPRGIDSAATQLPFLVRHLSRLQHQSRQGGSALKSLVAFMMSPAGLAVAIAALIPLVLALNEKMDLFRTTLLDTKKAGEGMIEQLLKIEKQFSEALGKEPIETLQSELDEVNRLLEIMEQRSLNWFQLLGFRAAAFFESFTDSEQFQRANTIMQSQQAAINKLEERRKELMAEILATRSAETDSTTETKKQVIEIIKLMDEMDKLIKGLPEFELKTEELIPMRTEEEMQQLEDDTREHMRQMGLARMQAEQRLHQLRIENTVAGLDTVARMEMRAAMEIEAIWENHHLTRRQQEELTAEIRKKLARDIANFEKLQELMKRQHQQDLWAQAVDSFQGFGAVIHGQSESNAKKRFELDKALSLASATTFGALAVNRAYASGGFAEAIPTAIAVAAQIVKILATKFQGAGGAGAADRQAATFRGEFSGMQGIPIGEAGQTNVNVPDTLRLVDRSGELLTKLEWAREKRGGNPNLVD